MWAQQTHRGIQLLHSHLGGGGPSKCRHMGTGGRGGLMSMQKFAYKFLKGLSRPSKKKGIQKWAGIVVKSEKRSGAVRKDYDWIKGRAAKFHKSSTTFWAKAVSQSKNKQKSAAITHSVDITDLGLPQYYF